MKATILFAIALFFFNPDAAQAQDLKDMVVGSWNKMNEKNKKVMLLTLREDGTFVEYWYKEKLTQKGTWKTASMPSDAPAIEFTHHYQTGNEIQLSEVFSILPGKIMQLDDGTYKPAKGKAKTN